MWTLWLPFVNNLWYSPFIPIGPGMCGLYGLGTETDKYVNEYWHNSSIYIVVKESNLPKDHCLSSHLSQTCLDRENSMANPSKFMKAHSNFRASSKNSVVQSSWDENWHILRMIQVSIVRNECLFQTCN